MITIGIGIIVLAMIALVASSLGSDNRSPRSSQMLGGKLSDPRVDRIAATYGVTIHSITPAHSEESAGMRYWFVGRDKAGANVSGHVSVGWGAGRMVFESSGYGPGTARAMRRADEGAQAPAEPDLETQMRIETSRRLDALQSNRASFLSYDSNGDGVVDEEEWSRVRKMIEDEVRREFADEAADGDSGVQDSDPNSSW